MAVVYRAELVCLAFKHHRRTLSPWGLHLSLRHKPPPCADCGSPAVVEYTPLERPPVV